ncbi:hypothetical protein DNTS_002080 [Danionella cerebrum]|uniref:Uncharacterized protein n=1 Tax=Danionella cerebrum TaxID=2873325 RepID=A0A553MZ63_9TELE|nr:hypothetical protein DNTS_002080 [Danionella translucida]
MHQWRVDETDACVFPSCIYLLMPTEGTEERKGSKAFWGVPVPQASNPPFLPQRSSVEKRGGLGHRNGQNPTSPINPPTPVTSHCRDQIISQPPEIRLEGVLEVLTKCMPLTSGKAELSRVLRKDWRGAVGILGNEREEGGTRRIGEKSVANINELV